MDNLPKEQFLQIEMYLKTIIVFLLVITMLLGYQTYKYFKATSYQTETYDKVSQYMDNNDNQGLLQYSDHVLSKDPENVDALWGQAVALFRMRRYHESKQGFEALKEKVPQWSEDIDNYLKIINKKDSSE